MLGRTDRLDQEVRDLTESDTGHDYDRYICLWASSVLALVDRDGPRLRALMDAQLADLVASGLHGNWLTLYWEALAMISTGEAYLPQLRLARQRAELEGRRADADCALALASPPPAGTSGSGPRSSWRPREARCSTTPRASSTSLLREQLVRPRLDPSAFAAATARGESADLHQLLAEQGL